MSQANNSTPSQPNEGCGPMLVGYFRIASYVGLVVGGIAFLIPNNLTLGTTLVIVCGGFLLLTRRKT